MEPSPTNDPLQAFHNRLAPILDNESRTYVVGMISIWNQAVAQDLVEQASVITLIHGNAASDRYLYGFSAVFAGVHEENGGEMPPHSPAAYQAAKQQQYQLIAEDSERTAHYFRIQQDAFMHRFPLTIALVTSIEYDLRDRLGASDAEIEDGYELGWNSALKVIMPSLMGY